MSILKNCILLIPVLFAFATHADDRADYNIRAAAGLVALFAALDRNSDERLTRQEVAGDLNMEPRFDDLDGNRDGVITREELDKYVVLRYGLARPS